MKGRDLFILAALVLVAGFAVADSLRGEGAPARPVPPDETTLPVVTTGPEQPPVERRKFPGVPGTGGSVVFTDTETCAVHEVALPGGDEIPNVVRSSSCELWVAPVTAKVAVGIGQASRDAVPFRFVDLARSSRSLGGSRAYFGFLIWSPDGQRAAWCTRASTGFDVELGGPARRLPRCPAAYTPAGEIAYAIGRRLVVEGRAALRADGGITFARWGGDGSLFVIVDGRVAERYVRGQRTHSIHLPANLEGKNPVLSPDNCAGLFRDGEQIRLIDLGCLGAHLDSFPGTAAAWSPDQEWIAVAERATIAFHPVAGGDVVRWPVGAVQIAWRR